MRQQIVYRVTESTDFTKGFLIFRISRFLVTCLNEMSFASVRVLQPSLLRLSRDIHMLNSVMCRSLHQIRGSYG